MSTLRLAALLILGVLAAAPAARADGLTPNQLHAAYGLPRKARAPRTVAVVTAYDAPSVAADLLAFSRRFGISPCAVTGATACFRKVNQRGQTGPLPLRDPTGQDWIVEAALGTQAARGVCQNCRILLVEADSSSKADLSAGVATAVRIGAREIVTAFSPAETIGDTAYAGAYSHPGVVVTAATGDFGFASEPPFPASMPGVVAVGGTHLSLARSGRHRSERAWSRGGSGCSSVFSAPVWQVAAARRIGCGARRALADVAAVADPGVLIYIGTPIDGRSGWFEAGGTSAASPIVAATFALAGGVGAGTSPGARLLAARHGLRDITTGTNGTCPSALCAARRGYDGPTGVGTPSGLTAFADPAAVLDPDRLRASVRPGAGRLRVDARGRIRLALVNANRFPVRFTLTLRSPGGLLLRGSLAVPHGARRSIGLRVPRGPLAVLRRRGALSAALAARLDGPLTSRATLRGTLRLTTR